MTSTRFSRRARHNFGVIKNPTHYQWGKEVAPGIAAIGTPGHTIGHTSFALQSGSGKLLIQSDVTNLAALFLRHPDWHFLFDIDAPLAEQTRRKFFDMASLGTDADPGLPSSVPGPRLCREGRHRLSVGAGDVDADDLRHSNSQ